MTTQSRAQDSSERGRIGGNAKGVWRGSLPVGSRDEAMVDRWSEEKVI